MNAITIREMSPGDVHEIAEIEIASYTMPWSETSFLSEVYSQHSITRIAELSGKIIAYVCIKKVADEGHLLNLTVHSDYRRRGIAKMIFNNAIEDIQANGCRFLYLEVRESNNAAKKMYEKLNFKIVGARKDYYIRPTENAVIMMLELKKIEGEKMGS
ncbi:MAG: ribosomal protein S18-alanine N-acetyltransferase [Dissulfurispiraceae bacterium]|jgi:ribosomal-protein-alanine N-acetyltransferase